MSQMLTYESMAELTAMLKKSIPAQTVAISFERAAQLFGMDGKALRSVQRNWKQFPLREVGKHYLIVNPDELRRWLYGTEEGLKWRKWRMERGRWVAPEDWEREYVRRESESNILPE